jgi:hypothetical protein
MEHETEGAPDDDDLDDLFEDDGEEGFGISNEAGVPDAFGGNRGGDMRISENDDDDEL